MDFLKQNTMSDEMADMLLGQKGCRVFKARIVFGDSTSNKIRPLGIYKTTIGGVMLSQNPFGGDEWESMDCEVIIIPKSKPRAARNKLLRIDQCMMNLNDDSEWENLAP